MKRVSPAIIAPLGLAALLILFAANDSTPAHAASFNPVGTVCLDDQTTVDANPLKPGIGKPTDPARGECDGSNAPGANVALTGSFGVGLGPDGESQQGGGDDTPDYNFGFNVSFTPPEWGVAKGTDIPIGAVVGTLNSNATLGLLGNPCWSPVLVPFEFVNASIDPANTIVPKPPGAKDRLEPLAQDANGNNIPDGADKWPSYLNEIDAFKNVKPAQIRARMFGVNATAVANLTIVLNFVIFEPGADLSDAQGKLLDIDPRLGYISVTVLQDPSAAASSDDSVSDFCSPLHSSTTTYGVTEDNPNTSADEGGFPNRTNPSCDTTCSYISTSAPQRDADGDGIENGLDPCPLSPDPNWDPRGPAYQPGSDDDADGLPNSCDPNPTVPSPIVINGFDEDRDQWRNRMDNCPLVKNGPSEEDIPGVGNNDDEDSDGIGDACDPHPNDADAEGDPKAVATVNNLTIGAGGTAPIETGTYRDLELEDLEQLLGPGCGCDVGGGGAADGGGAGTTDDTGTTGDTGDTGVAGEVTGPGTDAAGGAATGVGSLAPAVSSIPAWAAIASALGGAGLLGSLGAFLARFVRRRRF